VFGVGSGSGTALPQREVSNKVKMRAVVRVTFKFSGVFFTKIEPADK